MTNKMENINDMTMEKNYTVYMHVSPKGKVYIGITKNKVNVRWQNGRGYIKNEYFYRAIQKYGWDNFEHIIIENNLTKEQAENMEIELIAKYRSTEQDRGYNIENGGNTIGTHSIETKKKISKKNSGGNNGASKKVHCDNLIFVTIIECANYYRICNTIMTKWLKCTNKMPLEFQKLNLRYATNDDLNKCEKYDVSKHGDKANNIKIKEHSKNVHCDNLIFNTTIECANYYNAHITTISAWLKGRNKMPLEFQKLNLRYATNDDLNKCEKYDVSKHGDKANIVISIKKGRSKKIYCDNLIFNSIKDCANYYSLNKTTINDWLNGKNKMPLDFQQLNLRYATENDLNKYEKYDINKHGDKASNIIKVSKRKLIHCDNLIFNSITDCSKYYNVKMTTMSSWLNGYVKMPLDFQKLNLRYATNEDLNTYPRYTLENN